MAGKESGVGGPEAGMTVELGHSSVNVTPLLQVCSVTQPLVLNWTLISSTLLVLFVSPIITQVTFLGQVTLFIRSFFSPRMAVLDQGYSSMSTSPGATWSL